MVLVPRQRGIKRRELGGKGTSWEAGGRAQARDGRKSIPTWAPPCHLVLPSCSQSSQWLLTWSDQPQGHPLPLPPTLAARAPSFQPPPALITGRSGPTQAAAGTQLASSLIQWGWGGDRLSCGEGSRTERSGPGTTSQQMNSGPALLSAPRGPETFGGSGVTS